MKRIEVDLRTPEQWRAGSFWVGHRSRSYGVLIAFCPTVWAIGVELMTGSAKGVAIIIGPLWIGASTMNGQDRER